MNRLNKKINLFVFGLIIAAGSFYLLTYFPVLFPGFYFDYQQDYKQFSVYSDRPINRGIPFILEETVSKIDGSDLYSGDSNFDVYLCYNQDLYGWFARQADVKIESQGMTIEPWGSVFINLHEIGEVGQQYGYLYPYTLLSGSATHILAHELMHVLVTNHIGMFEIDDIPTWKREGYAEYAAARYAKNQDTSYSLRKRISKFMEGKYDKVDPDRRQYLRYEFVVEYLLDEKGITPQAFWDSTFNRDTVFSEMKQWAGN